MPKQIEIESIQEFLFDGSPNLATKMPALGPMYGNDQRNFLILLLITLHSGKTKTKLKNSNFGLDILSYFPNLFSGFHVDSVQLSSKENYPFILSKKTEYQEPLVKYFYVFQIRTITLGISFSVYL